MGVDVLSTVAYRGPQQETARGLWVDMLRRTCGRERAGCAVGKTDNTIGRDWKALVGHDGDVIDTV